MPGTAPHASEPEPKIPIHLFTRNRPMKFVVTIKVYSLYPRHKKRAARLSGGSRTEEHRRKGLSMESMISLAHRFTRNSCLKFANSAANFVTALRDIQLEKPHRSRPCHRRHSLQQSAGSC